MASSAPAARRRGVAKPPLMPRANERDDDDAPARAARDGATATDAVAPTMRRTPSFSDELGHYVKGFGRHDAYAGGEQVREDSTRREGERRRAVGEGRDGRENED
jgi:hypothetical protein